MLLERGIALFIHLLGVITLFVAMGLLQQSGARMRSASTVEEIRLWLGLAQTTSRMYPIATLLILVTGLYMTARMWTFGLPWVSVALASVVVMAVVGARVVGPGLGRIASAATGSGPVSAELARAAKAPGLWVWATMLNGMALGIVWIMVRKSGWPESIAALGGFAALGALAGARMTRTRASGPQLVEARQVSA